MGLDVNIYEYERQSNNDILLKFQDKIYGWDFFESLPIKNQEQNMTEISGYDLKKVLQKFNHSTSYITDDKYYILDISF